MSATHPAAAGRPAPAATIAVVAALAGLALWFVRENVVHYLVSFDATSYTPDFWPRRWGLLVHLTGGLVALGFGLAQLWLGLSGRTGTLHRALGRIYLGGVAIGSAGGFYMALTIDPKYFAYRAGLFMLSVAWLVTTAMAFVAIRRRAVEQHRQWMIRSYIVTFAFVTFRLASKWLTAYHVAPVDDIFTMLAWGCWSVPLLAAEPLLQLGKVKRRAA